MNKKTNYAYRMAKKLVEKELNKALQLLKDTEDKWNETLDLKLHDVAMLTADDCAFEINGMKCTPTNLDDAFQIYCEDEYMYFKDEYDIDMLDYVGRTSKFYIGKLHCDSRYTDYLYNAFMNASDSFSNSEVDFTYDCGRLFLNEQQEYVDDDDLINEILFLVDVVYEEVEDKVKEISEIYDYITAFKENQVDNFKEWLKENWIANL